MSKSSVNARNKKTNILPLPQWGKRKYNIICTVRVRGPKPRPRERHNMFHNKISLQLVRFHHIFCS